MGPLLATVGALVEPVAEEEAGAGLVLVAGTGGMAVAALVETVDGAGKGMGLVVEVGSRQLIGV